MHRHTCLVPLAYLNVTETEKEKAIRPVVHAAHWCSSFKLAAKAVGEQKHVLHC